MGRKMFDVKFIESELEKIVDETKVNCFRVFADNGYYRICADLTDGSAIELCEPTVSAIFACSGEIIEKLTEIVGENYMSNFEQSENNYTTSNSYLNVENFVNLTYDESSERKEILFVANFKNGQRVTIDSMDKNLFSENHKNIFPFFNGYMKTCKINKHRKNGTSSTAINTQPQPE